MDAVNLLARFPGKAGKGDRFPPPEGRRRAVQLLPALRRRPITVLAGRAVARAFGVEAWPYFLERRVEGALLVVMPHPSGVNRWWNDPAHREEARAFARRVVGKSAPRGARDA